MESKQKELLLINHIFPSDLISKKLEEFFGKDHVRRNVNDESSSNYTLRVFKRPRVYSALADFGRLVRQK